MADIKVYCCEANKTRKNILLSTSFVKILQKNFDFTDLPYKGETKNIFFLNETDLDFLQTIAWCNIKASKDAKILIKCIKKSNTKEVKIIVDLE